MTTVKSLTITTPSDRELRMTRVFDAPRHLVFDACTKPELLKRWLLGPDGWDLPICEFDLKVGGKIRYVWRKRDSGLEMGMGGVILELDPPGRLVATEKFDEGWYQGEAVGTILLVEKDGKTSLTQTMRYESREARDAVLKSPMEEGVGVSYDRLAEVLTTLA